MNAKHHAGCFEMQVDLGGSRGAGQMLHRMGKQGSAGLLLPAVKFCSPCLGEPILPQITGGWGGGKRDEGIPWA